MVRAQADASVNSAIGWRRVAGHAVIEGSPSRRSRSSIVGDNRPTMHVSANRPLEKVWLATGLDV